MEETRVSKNRSTYCEMVCPSAEELSVIKNSICCEQCGLLFRNEPRYRLHNLKVHQRKKLGKTIKENVHYHCPVETCVYAPESERYFTTMKYLKQHYLKVHAEKTFACTRCAKSFSTEAAKEGHMRICGIEFSCYCSKTYSTYEALLTHAKRSLHTIDNKYKSSLRRTNSKMARNISLSPTVISTVNKPVNILPSQNNNKGNNSNVNVTEKITVNIGVQTDECKKYRRASSPLKQVTNNNGTSGKRRVSKQTQTIRIQDQKHGGRSMETQTPDTKFIGKEPLKVRKRRKSNSILKKPESSLLKEDTIMEDNFTSSNLFPASPLPLRHDVGLQDFWEEKNNSDTQTIPEKDMFEALHDNVSQTDLETFYSHSSSSLIQCLPKSTVALMTLPYTEDSTVQEYSFSSTNNISRSDPMLTEKTFHDKFSSIETQTEQGYSQTFFDSDALSRTFALSSTIETQTTDNFDNMEQLFYNNTYTQTSDEMISSDLVLTNIQTQTAWTQLDDTTVSAETQTKSLICETGCNISMGACRSWLNAQTSHTETQTDLLSIFEGLQ
ncbi:protein indeterminate-domain 13 [Vespa crabro]|uniref:protein indeterminate-domain 13 n=1 Tax=Vespa crabro TaxID=7445 RepID=UPI001F011AF8|nr:protein indeterminate-domain 13 [Vespa crabro]XP_046814960.1 protein indeterminate-domain 13 [Vespa crabro]